MAQKMTNRFIPVRSIVLVLFFTIFAVVLTGRLFYLQIVSYDMYEAKVLDNISATTTVAASRGVIYDRNMSQLASNYSVYRIFVSPRSFETEEQKQLVADGLSKILGIESSTILGKIDKYYRYADITIKKDVEKDKAEEIQTFIAENNLSTMIYVEASYKRYYPYNNLASQVIGFCNADGGVLGIELKYNSYLTGTAGKYITARDASGKSMATKYESYVEPKNGANLVTTLDIRVQSALENQVKKTYFESESMNRTTGIVMDVNTGAVLGMATYPDFDLNNPYSFDDEYMKIIDSYTYDSEYKYNNFIEKLYEYMLARDNFSTDSEEYNNAYMELLYSIWKNKSVSELYEPGSTFKIVTTSMAFEENLIDRHTEFTCYYPYEVDGTKIRCHRYGGHGTNEFWYMLQQSCNPTLIQVAQILGRDTFYKYYEAFGYTSTTGIDLPAESSPIFHEFSGFNSVELAVYSFGQTFKVTPIQQITAISAVANGGYLVRPHVVSQVVDDDGNIIYEADTTPKRQVVSEAVCDEISLILEDGVSGNGGAKNTRVAGYKIAAKTGTSEVRDILDEEGNSFLRVGSTVAFAPADDPQVAVLIVCDQPSCENIYGAYVAAPYVAAVLEEILPYLGVERNYTEEELANMNVTLRNYVGLSVTDVTQDLKARGITCKVYGEGDKVTYQAPVGGSLFNKNNGTVILYSGDYTPNRYSTVPNLVGKTALAASQAIINAGLNPVIEGVTGGSSSSNAVVIQQEPAAGESVSYGSTVTVTMRYIDGSD